LSDGDIAGESATPIPEENIDTKAAAISSSSSDYEEKTEVIYGQENVIHCKKLMQFLEVRHLDRVIGYFSTLDGKLITSTAYGEENKILPHLVTSTVKALVDQHRYFFETLWSKTIPAKQRIKELEEGAKREFVETIRDPSEIEKISFDLIKKADEEILILFSTTSVFRHQEKAGVIMILREAALPPSNLRIRILIPALEEEKVVSRRTTTANETILQLKARGIDVRRSAKQYQEQQQNFLQNDKNNLMLMIVDQSLSLTVELNEDVINEETSDEDAIGLATYSNTDPTVFAYTSIFENLWMRSEV
jgi:two-component system sensor histidine kinase VicK